MISVTLHLPDTGPVAAALRRLLKAPGVSVDMSGAGGEEMDLQQAAAECKYSYQMLEERFG